MARPRASCKAPVDTVSSQWRRGTEASEVLPGYQHPGNVIHMVIGGVTYGHGNDRNDQGPGDSLLFDGEAPHRPDALLDLVVPNVTGSGHLRSPEQPFPGVHLSPRA